MCIRDRASPLNSKTPVIIAVVVGVIAVCLVIFGVAAATKRIFLDLQESALEPVSYTHLDVYKRQALADMQRRLAP